MTLPYERTRAVLRAESFLADIASGKTPRIPRAVREDARMILRHYPSRWDLWRVAEASAEIFSDPDGLSI